MEIPEDLVLTAEDIPYLRNSQLAQLTEISANYFSAWASGRHISERLLAGIAVKMGLSKGDLLKALELKRQEAQKAQKAREKADQLIQFLKQREEASV